MHIVAIDDSEVLLEYMSILLEGAGHTVYRADTAHAAIDTIASNPIDLVLSDVYMAGMGGFELAKKLRGNPDSAGIPIVFVTGDESDDFKARSRSIGVNGWLRKPFKPEQILGMVRSFEL